MDYTLTNHYPRNSKEFLEGNMMGPNAFRVTEELTSFLNINSNSRILDLGCGAGLSSILLAEKYEATVFAADLWVSPSDNYKRFEMAGLGEKIIPLSVDATKGLPFAEEYFDFLISVDAYHYFGDTKEMLPSLIPYVKRGGYIAVAIPGLKYEFGENVPDEMKPWWDDPEIARTIRSIDWWKNLWSEAEGIKIVECREMDCHEQAWEEWLASSNPYAKEDIPMMEAEGGKYFNHVQLIAEKL
jgi:cyclopropane fatty-acyl-phospholipid synthase-like methyltransferase